MLENYLDITDASDGTDIEALYREYIGTVSFVPGPFPGWQVGEFTDEHRANLSKAASLRKRTPQHIAALHNGRRGKKNSVEHKKALIDSRIGTQHTKESKKKMSDAKKGTKLSGQHKEKLLKHLSKVCSSVGKSSQEKYKNDPERQRKFSERMKLWWAERKKNQGG